jgi:hypothetical protein
MLVSPKLGWIVKNWHIKFTKGKQKTLLVEQHIFTAGELILYGQIELNELL